MRERAHHELVPHGFDDEVHQPVRFLVLGLLRQSDGGVPFRTLRDLLGLTDGNLTSHLDRLELLEYLFRRFVHDARRRFTIIHLTEVGAAAYDRHCEALRILIDDPPTYALQPSPSHPPDAGPGDVDRFTS